MPKQQDRVQFLPFMLESASSTPLYTQLYERLRQAILNGQLAAGTQLPSTRALASQLGISRTTVVLAFDQLLREGYVEGKKGSGTYVATLLPEDMLYRPAPARTLNAPPAISQQRNPSQRGMALAAIYGATTYHRGEGRAFRPGVPDLDHFPFGIWSRLAAHHWRRPPRNLLGYSHPAGYYPLRSEIAAYLRATRGVRCSTEQVFVVSGSQQAIDLAARVLLDPGDAVWMENPGNPGAHSALVGAGARIIPVEVDNEGLDVVAGTSQRPEARMAYVTPSYQFPLGVTMSLERRLMLLQWASRANAWILEDDYDCEFRYAGRPSSALQGLDITGQVIYIGTFGRVLFPGLRLGYLVVPSDLVDAFTATRAAVDRHSPIFDQVVLTDFITQGHFTRHIRQMRGIYAQRQTLLVEAAAQELAGLLTVDHAEAGMHLLAQLTGNLDDRVASQKAASQHIIAPPLSAYSIVPSHHNALLLGYTGVSEEEIRAGVRQLAIALA